MPDGEGLPLSLLAELMGQIRCDAIAFQGFDCQWQKTWFVQGIPDPDYAWHEENDPVHWQLYWDCQPCSYPDRTGDLRSVVKISDFYSARQWHSVGMYRDIYRPLGFEHDLMLTLPVMPGPAQGPGRTMRLFIFRGPGPDFPNVTGQCSRCCARTCTRPSWMPSGAAIPSPGSPPGNGSCCACWQLGTPTRTSPADSAFPREQCVLTWKTSTNGWTSPAAPPRSPAPSPTGSPSAHRPGEGGLSRSRPGFLALVAWPGIPCEQGSRGRNRGGGRFTVAPRPHPTGYQRTSQHPWLAERPVMHGRRSGGSASEKPTISAVPVHSGVAVCHYCELARSAGGSASPGGGPPGEVDASRGVTWRRLRRRRR